MAVDASASSKGHPAGPQLGAALGASHRTPVDDSTIPRLRLRTVRIEPGTTQPSSAQPELTYTLVSPSELDAGLQRRWQEIAGANPHLRSPYFSVHFTLAVASVRDDVRIVVIEERGGDVVGFFPFQRGALGWGRPVGGPFSDHHGVVTGPDTRFDARALLRAARLSTWEFDHLLAAQSPFAPFHASRAVSPVLDLTGGYDAYVEARHEAGSGRIKQIERKARKLEREVGPVRFEPHRLDISVLERVFAEKSKQCREADLPDVFGPAWSRDLLLRVLETQRDDFAGCLSVLYVGDEVAAAHAGMRSDRAWHWWFPTYNRDYAKYSPGGLLLLHVAREASRLGLDHVDLGKGDDSYKSSFANGAIELAEGCVTRPSLGSYVRGARHEAEACLRRSRLVEPARGALRRANQSLRRRQFS